MNSSTPEDQSAEEVCKERNRCGSLRIQRTRVIHDALDVISDGHAVRHEALRSPQRFALEILVGVEPDAVIEHLILQIGEVGA